MADFEQEHIGTVAMGDSTVTEKMIEAALNACPLNYFQPRGDGNGYTRCSANTADIRLMLTAALSTRPAQEPVAAYTIDFTGCDHMSRNIANIEKIAAAGSKGATEVVYLYRGPSAPQPVLSQPEVKAGPAEQIIGQIEALFPDWPSYRDLVDCIECTLHRLKSEESTNGR